MRIISLTTIPPRFSVIQPTLLSLLRQRTAMDEIRLYVPRRYRRFPDYDGAAPQVPEGISVIRTDDDLGPASKVLFAVRDFAGTDASILFCDDDRLFRSDWAGGLFEAQAERPDECVALLGKTLKGPRQSAIEPRAIRRGRSIDAEYRLRQIRSLIKGALSRSPVEPETRRKIRSAGYADILLGLGGVVVRPHFFDDVAYQIPDVCWGVDDVWLSGMLARRGIRIWLPQDLQKPAAADAGDVDPLYKSAVAGHRRSEANSGSIRYLQEHFGIWR
ncbi:glycosyltransferase [Mangrovicella endophytica]|uniref:glycosyltransferase n=1 Tax=Mangrovicella endophytica TaxID=2066697 RepID=UPI000C9E2673|nr:glycosyltransferase [Mangrovicella endophytica]